MSETRKVALITGASGGIGAAVARTFARDGVDVVGIARTEANLVALGKQLAGRTGYAHLAVDVMADDAPRRAVDLAIEKFGRLDYLINNAGIGQPKPVHETTDEILDLFLNIHLRAPFRFCREVLRVMGTGSSIVNVVSSYAVIGGLRGGAYAAGKTGMVGLTRHMAAQYGRRGVRSNAVAPGVIETDMTAYAWNSEVFKRMNDEMTPSDRSGKPDDVAEAIVFLCSDRSLFINGQVLTVDGGWTTTKYLTSEAMFAKRVPRESRD